MAGLGSSTTIGATPNRATSVEFDVGGSVNIRPPWARTKRAHEIGRAAPAVAGVSINVMLLPGGAWCLAPYQVTQTFERTVTQEGIIRQSEWNLPQGIEEAPLQRKADLPGVTYDSGVSEKGDHFLYKKVANTGTYAQKLDADAAAFPSPSLLTANVPVDRVASGRKTYPPNQGYMFRFHVPGILTDAKDTLFNFLFGGPTETEEGASAGEFAMSVFGNGLGKISELVSGIWKEHKEFRWAPPGQVSGRAHSILAQPHGPNRLDTITGSTDSAPWPTMIGTPQYPTPPPLMHRQTLPQSKLTTGVKKKANMTGAGTIRVDQRRDLRIPWQVSVLRYPTSGTLIDGAFVVDTGLLPAGTKIYLIPKTGTPTGTSITATLHDASTHAALTQNEDGTWASVSGQQRYYAKFTFSGPGDRTPYLYGYEVYVQGYRETRIVTPTTGGNLRRVSVVGPDLDPSHEMASLEIKDLKNELGLLGTRAGIRTRVKVAHSAGTSVLFEGIVVRSRKRRRGRTANAGMTGAGGVRVYPSAQWANYDVQLVGQWARLARQMSFASKDFGWDLTADLDPVTGERPPWKATDAIRWLFEQAGWPPSQVDVPDLDVRLFNSGADKTEFLLQPTASFAEYINKLARDYLGAFVVWDANAGSEGMWRLVLLPEAPYNTLWAFTTTPAANKITGNANAYGANTTFIRDAESYVKPPEANFIVVTGSGDLSGDGALTSTVRYAFNPKSYNFDPSNPTADPTHPDYTDGEFHPLVFFDPTLTTPEALAFICRRLANQTLFAQKWVQFDAPMVYVTDATDTQLGGKYRPLRVYDAITVDGNTAIVRSVQADWERDHLQFMRVEAQFTDNTLLY